MQILKLPPFLQPRMTVGALTDDLPLQTRPVAGFGKGLVETSSKGGETASVQRVWMQTQNLLPHCSPVHVGRKFHCSFQADEPTCSFPFGLHDTAGIPVSLISISISDGLVWTYLKG